MSGPCMGVEAFIPPNEKWKKMRDVYVACEAAKMDPPKEVSQFFQHEYPDEAGVCIAEKELRALGAVKDYRANGLEMVLANLPSDVTVVRFTNSY